MSDEQSADFLDALAGQGYENFTANSYQVPFLKIAQPLSPEIEKQDSNFIKGLEAGQFFNSLTKKNYGSTIKLIPLRQKEVWLEYAPNCGSFKGIHAPGSIQTTGDIYDKGLKTLDGNDITDALVFYCLIADEIESGPIIFTLYGSGFGHGKTWNSLIMTSKTSTGKQAPYFGSVWELTTSFNQNDKGKWYQIGAAKTTNVKRDRSITIDELNKYILPAREILKSVDQRADYSQITGGSEAQKVITDTSHSDF